MAEHRADQRRKAVNRLAHVDRFDADVGADRRGQNHREPRRRDSTNSIALRAASSYRRTVAPSPASISICALRDACGSDRFGYLADQRGMFSLLGGTDAQIQRLRDEFGVYVVGGGRLNMAGLTDESIPRVAKAIAQVL